MVKLGFIVEGATEKIILEKSDFFSYLQSKQISFIPEVIDAGGNGNLLPQNIGGHTKILKNKGATHIIILTDLDEDVCITETKKRISPLPGQYVAVSLKQVESWFLADTEAMCILFNDNTYQQHTAPEVCNNAYEEIKSLRMQKAKRGTGSKVTLANTMVRNGFSIIRAAQHPNCSSAKYFLDKIEAIIATT